MGFEYEEIDRDEHELNDTDTYSYKIALKSRFNKQLSGRISYLYQDINDPLNGAETGIMQGGDHDDPNYSGVAWDLTSNHTGDPGNTTAVFYWNSVYPNRDLDTSVDPEDVHEVKMSSTWAPKANMALTVSNRFRYEENDHVHYEQHTYAPGVSFYYAPTNKIDLTMSYNYNHQKTENRMCVGWYHG